MKARAAIVWFARLAITIALLTWVLSHDNVRVGIATAKFERPWFIVAAVACGGAASMFAAWRWYVCLRAYECALPFVTVLRFLLAGNAAGLLSIGPLGMDAVRGALAARRLPEQKGAVLASIALDHMCALPGVALLAAFIVVSMGLTASIDHQTITVIATLAIAIIALAIAIRVFKPTLHHWLVATFTKRLNVKGATFAAVIAMPVLIFHYAVFWCAAQALALPADPIGLFGAIVVADSISALPITIAGIGFREKTFEVLLFKWYAVSPALAVKASLTGFAILAAWALVGALVFPLGKSQTDKDLNAAPI